MTTTSVCIALLQFACIIIFHIAKTVGPMLQRLAKKKRQEMDNTSVQEDELIQSGRYKVTTQEVTLDNAKQQRKCYNATDYREPLLDDV